MEAKKMEYVNWKALPSNGNPGNLRGVKNMGDGGRKGVAIGLAALALAGGAYYYFTEQKKKEEEERNEREEGGRPGEPKKRFEMEENSFF